MHWIAKLFVSLVGDVIFRALKALVLYLFGFATEEIPAERMNKPGTTLRGTNANTSTTSLLTNTPALIYIENGDMEWETFQPAMDEWTDDDFYDAEGQDQEEQSDESLIEGDFNNNADQVKEQYVRYDQIDSLRGAPGSGLVQPEDFTLPVGPIFNFVSGSPFLFYIEAIDSGYVTAYGPGLSHGVVYEQAYFTINTKNAGAGSPFEFTVGPIAGGGTHKVHAAGPGLERGEVDIAKDCEAKDVEIERSRTKKDTFLGDFRNKNTGVEFRNASAQTVQKPRPPPTSERFCRDTQTCEQRNMFQQTKNNTSTQMTGIGVYTSNLDDKLIAPGDYVTADEHWAMILSKVINFPGNY